MIDIDQEASLNIDTDYVSDDKNSEENVIEDQDDIKDLYYVTNLNL